jgi:predicted ester cyclase
MSAEENEALIREMIEEVWCKGDLVAVDRYFAIDYVDHSPLPGQAPGAAGHKEAVATIRSAFPDLYLILEDIFCEGDKVALYYTMQGTHRGQFMGTPPTNKPFSVTGMINVRIAEGKVVERWANLDTLGLMKQLGVVPSPVQFEHASST